MSTKYTPTTCSVNVHAVIDGLDGHQKLLAALNIKTDGFMQLAADYHVNMDVDIYPAIRQQHDGTFTIERADIIVSVSDNNGVLVHNDRVNAHARNNGSRHLFDRIRAFLDGYRTAKPITKSMLKARERYEAAQTDNWAA